MWHIDTTRIFVQELVDDSNQIIPRLQPLDGDTILQLFGTETSIFKLKGKVVGYTDLNTLKGYSRDATTHVVLESISGVAEPDMFNMTLYLKKVTASRDKTLMQTIREDLDCYAPVFDVDIELYTD